MSEEQTPIEIIQSIHDDLWNCSISQKEYESIRSKLLTLRELLTKEKEQIEELIKLTLRELLTKEKEQIEELIKKTYADALINLTMSEEGKISKEQMEIIYKRAEQYYNEVVKGRN
jgi:hypothetical protein